MDSFVMFMHLYNCLPTLHLASQPYMPRTLPAFPLDVHYKSGKLKASAYPHQIAQNVWILTSAPSTVTTTITLICPGENRKFITIKKSIHMSYDYHQLAALHHHTFIYLHDMNIRHLLSTFLLTWQTTTWST